MTLLFTWFNVDEIWSYFSPKKRVRNFKICMHLIYPSHYMKFHLKYSKLSNLSEFSFEYSELF